jgi:hypothetical protein
MFGCPLVVPSVSIPQILIFLGSLLEVAQPIALHKSKKCVHRFMARTHFFFFRAPGGGGLAAGVNFVAYPVVIHLSPIQVPGVLGRFLKYFRGLASFQHLLFVVCVAAGGGGGGGGGGGVSGSVFMGWTLCHWPSRI